MAAVSSQGVERGMSQFLWPQWPCNAAVCLFLQHVFCVLQRAPSSITVSERVACGTATIPVSPRNILTPLTPHAVRIWCIPSSVSV